ncbi:glycosyltransferase family 4 protein, partial [Flavobacterium collinsii]
MRIIAVHLLNNYSGSPKVLMQLLKCWTRNGIETHLYTCAGEGFLSNIPYVKPYFYWYRFAKNPMIRLLFLLTSQFLLAVQLFFTLNKKDILYINTVFPFGAAFVGKIIGCKVIYHIHETGVKPKILNQFLFGIVKLCAKNVVYVSNFLAEQQPLKVKNNVLYNVIENSFRKEAQFHLGKDKKSKIILMISSLKRYKGINEFAKLAELCPHYTFKLVLNANQKEIDHYFKDNHLPSNLIVHTSQTEVHPFYKEASIVVNLTVTQLCKETFGLTILEAMTYGIPTIVPPIGGMTELVENNKNGYLIDSQELKLISDKINQLFENPFLYHQMSQSAVIKSTFFN